MNALIRLHDWLVIQLRGKKPPHVTPSPFSGRFIIYKEGVAFDSGPMPAKDFLLRGGTLYSESTWRPKSAVCCDMIRIEIPVLNYWYEMDLGKCCFNLGDSLVLNHSMRLGFATPTDRGRRNGYLDLELVGA